MNKSYERIKNFSTQITVEKTIAEIERLRDIGLDPVDTSLPQEEQIVLKQINYFTLLSQERSLTLDETRAFDLFMKNKRMIDDKKPKKNDDEVPKGTTDADLLRIVSNDKERPKKKRSKS